MLLNSIGSPRMFAVAVALWLSGGVMASAPGAWQRARQLRPSLLQTDLPRLIDYLELDQDQAAAAMLLWEDQIEQETQALAQVQSELRRAPLDTTDDLVEIREDWGRELDRSEVSIVDDEGQAVIRDIVRAYLQDVAQTTARPSHASEQLDDWRQHQQDSRQALLADMGLLLTEAQLPRWQTVEAARALARSTWKPILPAERLDLDALLLRQLGQQAQTPAWVELRRGWLERVGQAMAARDAVLARLEGPLLDAQLRRQPGRELLIQRRMLEARAALANTLDEVRMDMSQALAQRAPDVLNGFQMEARSIMHPGIFALDRVDRLARLALQDDHLDAQRKAEIEAIWAAHRARRLAVQAALIEHADEVAQRRHLRIIEHRLLGSLLGPDVGLLSIADEEAMVNTRRLNAMQARARAQAINELAQAVGDDRWDDVVNAGNRLARSSRDRQAAKPLGHRADLVLPFTPAASDADAPTP